MGEPALDLLMRISQIMHEAYGRWHLLSFAKCFCCFLKMAEYCRDLPLTSDLNWGRNPLVGVKGSQWGMWTWQWHIVEKQDSGKLIVVLLFVFIVKLGEARVPVTYARGIAARGSVVKPFQSPVRDWKSLKTSMTDTTLQSFCSLVWVYKLFTVFRFREWYWSALCKVPPDSVTASFVTNIWNGTHQEMALINLFEIFYLLQEIVHMECSTTDTFQASSENVLKFFTEIEKQWYCIHFFKGKC